MKKIIFILAVLMMSNLLSGCGLLQQSFNQKFAGPPDFHATVSNFYKENLRWPKDVKELKDYADKKYMSLDAAMFKSLELEENKKGGLNVYYSHFLNEGDSGYFTVIKPIMPISLKVVEE